MPPFSLVLLIPVANLPPVSTIPAVNLPLVSMTPVANKGNNIRLLRPVANLELRISPRIFENIRNGPNGILRESGAWGKLIHEKNQKSKIS